MIRQSHNWGKLPEQFKEHHYLSDVGEPSNAPESGTETWTQYLSGTDKDHTVEWDFYCTDGLDVSGNQAPDGMTNPYRKPEGSFYTLKEIFCPIHIPVRVLPDGFNGRIEIENRFNFTNTGQCS